MDANFTRLLEILQIVPGAGQAAASTSDIHRRLQVRGVVTTVRTVQRDLESLSRAYGIECDTRTKPFGWRWPRAARKFSIPEMDWPEALSFRLLEAYLSGLLPESVACYLAPWFEQAKAKLDHQFQASPMRRWPQKIRVISPNQPLLAPTVERSVHGVVTEALLADRQLELTYRAIGSPRGAKYRAHPLALVQEGNVLYLVARLFDYPDVRTLAMHRIQKATGLDAPAEPPPRFDLDNYLREGGFGCGSYGKIWLDATWQYHTGNHLLQAKLSAAQVVTELDEGTVRIKATVQYTQRLVWWLLGFGPNVLVNGPAKLRREIAQAHLAASKRYAEPRSSREAKA